MPDANTTDATDRDTSDATDTDLQPVVVPAASCSTSPRAEALLGGRSRAGDSAIEFRTRVGASPVTVVKDD